jgi:catechol 2,3-dioxygenase-like lactoylglutathione lyase family enzyme
MTGRLHHLILDAADIGAEAAFWSALLGQPVTYRSDDFVVVAADDRTSGLAFQLAPDHRAPTWPDGAVPQQMHLDVMVDDLDAGDAEALALGARPLGGDHVYADPAGHPFCLIPRPHWAPPVRSPHEAAPTAGR